MSQYDNLIKGTVLKDSYGNLHEVGSEGPSLSMANYEVMMDALNNPDGKGPPWWVVGIVSVVGGAVIAIPDPVPGSGVIALGMVAAAWWAKLNAYGVSKNF